MTQPYIDCAIALARRGIKPENIRDIICKVGEGTVHRLWEDLAVKQRPPNAYAAKFSTPYCMAVGFFDGKAGLAQFTPERIIDPAVLALAGKIGYVVDPQNPYPANFTGHLRATLNDGESVEIERPWMRGGAKEPLTLRELENKFRDNALHGGWREPLIERMLALYQDIFHQPDVGALRHAGQ
ncbi:MmgE/PrpD family protein [Martelella alba]|uniref:MmgE/PrpD family protein n=1 Tax=Martelella alba TaxID=2590451 RepID=UPI001E658016|nr:MmgE/PrpD family protein [Martelella alba]